MAVTAALSKVAGGGGGGSSTSPQTQPLDDTTLKYADDKRRYDYETQLWEHNKAVQAYQNDLAHRQIEVKNQQDEAQRLRRVNEALAMHRAKMASRGIDPSTGSVLAYSRGLLNEAKEQTTAAKKLLALRKEADQSAIEMQLNPAGMEPSQEYYYWQASKGQTTHPPGQMFIEETPDGQRNYIDMQMRRRPVSDFEF